MYQSHLTVGAIILRSLPFYNHFSLDQFIMRIMRFSCSQALFPEMGLHKQPGILKTLLVFPTLKYMCTCTCTHRQRHICRNAGTDRCQRLYLLQHTENKEFYELKDVKDIKGTLVKSIVHDKPISLINFLTDPAL